MSKIIEYLIVAAAAIAIFLAAATVFFGAARDNLRKDCVTMGQHRDGSLYITCAIAEERKP